MLPTKFQVNWIFASGEETKIDFQDGGHLGFLIGTVLAIFYLQVTLMLPTKFQVNWPFGSGEEGENRFSRWQPWHPSWIADRKDFSFFLLYKTMILTKFQISWPFGSGEEANLIFKIAAMAAILDFRSEQFSFFFFFFYLPVIPMLSSNFQLAGSGEEAKYRFSR